MVKCRMPVVRIVSEAVTFLVASTASVIGNSRGRPVAREQRRDSRDYPIGQAVVATSVTGVTNSSSEVEWALAFRVQPKDDVIIVDQIPAGPSDPSIDEPTKPRPMRTASAIGTDATRS